MSPALENTILLIWLGAVLLSLPVAILLTRRRRAALAAVPSVPVPAPPLPEDAAEKAASPAVPPPVWRTPDDVYAPPHAAPDLPPPPPLHSCWQRKDAWFALGLLLVLGLLMGPALAGPAAMAEYQIEFTRGLFLGQLVFHLIVAGLVLHYLLTWRKLSPVQVFGLRNAGFWKSCGLALGWIVCAIFGLAAVGAVLMPLMESMAGGKLQQQMLVQAAPDITDPGTRLLMFLTLAVGAPLMEEVVFRGIFFSVAARFIHPVYAAVASGAFFAVIHNSLYALVPLTLLGTALAWAYHRSRTLAVPILMHAIFNSLQFLLLFYGPPELRQ